MISYKNRNMVTTVLTVSMLAIIGCDTKSQAATEAPAKKAATQVKSQEAGKQKQDSMDAKAKSTKNRVYDFGVKTSPPNQAYISNKKLFASMNKLATKNAPEYDVMVDSMGKRLFRIQTEAVEAPNLYGVSYALRAYYNQKSKTVTDINLVIYTEARTGTLADDKRPYPNRAVTSGVDVEKREYTVDFADSSQYCDGDISDCIYKLEFEMHITKDFLDYYSKGTSIYFETEDPNSFAIYLPPAFFKTLDKGIKDAEEGVKSGWLK